MKKISGNIAFRSLLVFFFSLVNTMLWAQDSTSTSHSVTVTKESTTTTTWYMQPWVWVVGAAVFIIILIALFRGNSSTDKEVTRSNTTVIKDKDY
jgi:hypothetical protein